MARDDPFAVQRPKTAQLPEADLTAQGMDSREWPGRVNMKRREGRARVLTWAARVGAKVRDLRLMHGISQGELAAAIGSTAQSVARLEAGRGARGPTVERLHQIASAFGAELVVAFDHAADTRRTRGRTLRSRDRS